VKHSHCRISGVIALVIIQLVIIPATHLLHVGCEHLGSEHLGSADPAIFDSAVHAVETVWGWCWPSHCCDHCEPPSVITDGRTDGPQPIQPIHPPHDENTCPVCLVAFAARLSTTAPMPALTNERMATLVVREPNFEKPTPRYTVLSRGPPDGTGSAT
jgi:hypothetical protein